MKDGRAGPRRNGPATVPQHVEPGRASVSVCLRLRLDSGVKSAVGPSVRRVYSWRDAKLQESGRQAAASRDGAPRLPTGKWLIRKAAVRRSSWPPPSSVGSGSDPCM